MTVARINKAMNKQTGKRALYAWMLAATLVACGGGENDEGALSAFSVTPNEMTLNWAQDADPDTPPACGSGFVGRPFVNGGAAPYTIQNTNPGAMVAVRTGADPNTTAPISRLDAGGAFDVYAFAGCFETLSINIVDALGRQVVVSVSNQPAE
jgi:hypothetical protein